MIDPQSPDYADTPASPCRRGYGYAPAGSAAGPVVSILTPYYDTDASFLETARSVFAQSLQAWQWVIVDDGSTEAASIARLAAVAGDPRIVVLRQANGGPSAARNAAFRQAAGRYVCLLDSDDMLEPTFLEKCVWFLESHPAMAFCNAWSVNFGDETYLWRTGFERGRAFLRANSGPPMSVIRRQAFADAGGFDESIRFGHEDWDFWLALANAGHWGHTLPEFLEWYRKRGSGRYRQIMSAGSVHREFEAAMAGKYAGLAGRFPVPEADYPQPYETVATQLPFDNPLAAPADARRILFLVPWMVTGGADRVNLDWIALLQRQGWQVSVCATLAAEHDWMHEFARLTPDVFVLPHFLRLADYPRFIHYLIRSRRIDTVLIAGSTLGYQLLPFLRAQSPQAVFLDLCHVEEPGWLNGGHPRFAVGYRDMLDINIVTTAALRRRMTERGGDPDRIEVCHSGIDIAPPPAAAAELRAALGLQEGKPVIVFAGRICEQKRPELLAGILDGLARRGVGFQALIVGEGDLRGMLEGMIRDSGLEAAVRFTGAVDHGRWIGMLGLADLFLLPSRYEGISVALLEAMAMGVVAVTADVGGQGEAVTAEAGVLVPPGAAELERYVAAVADLLGDAPRRRRMAEAARERIRTGFSRDAAAARLAAILARARRLAAERPRQAPAPGFALELAALAVEYARLSGVAHHLWARRASPRGGAEAAPLPADALLRLITLLGATRLGAALLGSRTIRRFAKWLLGRLEARRYRAAAGAPE